MDIPLGRRNGLGGGGVVLIERVLRHAVLEGGLVNEHVRAAPRLDQPVAWPRVSRVPLWHISMREFTSHAHVWWSVIISPYSFEH